MMKLLIFGDLQAHPWQEDERPERLQDFIKVIKTVRSNAYKQAVDGIVFLGDLFESKRLIRADIVSLIYAELSRPFIRKTEAGKIERIPFYFLAGNHDFYGGECTLSPLHDPATRQFAIIDKPEVVTLSGERFLFIPFGNDHDKPKDTGDNFAATFVHCDLPNVSLGSGIVSKSNGLPEWIDEVKTSLIVAGHYHSPGEVKGVNKPSKIVCCGAPMEHNWKDVDETALRGLLLLTVENGKASYSRIVTSHLFPRFFSSADHIDAREGFDFTRKTVTKSAGTAKQHEGAKAVAGGNTAQVVAAYLKHEKPNLTPEEFKRYYQTGIKFLKGTDDAEIKED